MMVSIIASRVRLGFRVKGLSAQGFRDVAG